ncbi:GntR family transcriptional regulator [Thermodesulfobacteriota bacterium]
MEFQKKDAIYLQIVEKICENILAKRWQEGEKIPSVRELAITVEVNPNTVMRSYTYLQDIGVIFMKRGIGYFVSENAYEKTVELMKGNFIKDELPKIFKAVKLLKMDFDELKTLYSQYERETDENK